MRYLLVLRANFLLQENFRKSYLAGVAVVWQGSWTSRQVIWVCKLKSLSMRYLNLPINGNPRTKWWRYSKGVCPCGKGFIFLLGAIQLSSNLKQLISPRIILFFWLRWQRDMKSSKEISFGREEGVINFTSLIGKNFKSIKRKEMERWSNAPPICTRDLVGSPNAFRCGSGSCRLPLTTSLELGTVAECIAKVSLPYLLFNGQSDMSEIAGYLRTRHALQLQSSKEPTVSNQQGKIIQGHCW